MSKFEVMSGVQQVAVVYDLYSGEFEFHSDYYEGDCSGGRIEITANPTGYAHKPPKIRFLTDEPELGDIIQLLGVPATFIVDKIGVFGLYISIFAGMADHG